MGLNNKLYVEKWLEEMQSEVAKGLAGKGPTVHSNKRPWEYNQDNDFRGGQTKWFKEY